MATAEDKPVTGDEIEVEDSADMIEDVVGEVDDMDKDDDANKDETEDKAAVRKRRVFVHPVLPRDLNNPVLKPYLDKATLVISRFIGVKGGKKRGHVVLWYKTPEEAVEMAEELKTIELSGRPVTVQVAEGVTVPVGTIMEDWNKFTPPEQETHKRQLFVNNLAPGTPKELLRVLFPVALDIEIPLDEDGNMCGHAILTFENKREAEICMKNATGIKIQNVGLTMHLVETEEEIKKIKEDEEKMQQEEGEKSEKDKADAEKKELQKDKRDLARAKEDDDDSERKRKTPAKDRPSTDKDDSKRGRYERRSSGRDNRGGGGRGYGGRSGGGGGGNWRNRGGDGGFGGSSNVFGGGSDTSLMGLLNTLQQVQQLQQQGGRRGGGGRW